MTLDATTIAVLALIEGGFALQLLLWYAISVIARGQSAPAPVPVVPVPAPVPQPVPSPLPVPGPQPTPIPVPKPVPVPAPAPAPVPPVAPVFRNINITATSWAGTGDDNNSAYTGKNIDGNHTIGYSLPARIEARPPARIRSPKTGRVVSNVPLLDVGPWNTKDPYWATGARPQAESGTDLSGRHTNHAGIDLTPACWAALGYTGNLNEIKDVVDWDFESHFTDPVAPGVPVPQTGPAQPAPVAGGTVLQHNVWPTQAECPSFYGSPSVVASSLVTVTCPWTFMIEGTHSNKITIHKKCAASLERVLNYIWEQCGKSQDQIHAFGYNVFDGSYVVRPIGGTSTPSTHSYGAAMDWNAAANPQHAPLSQTKFKSDSLIVFAFESEGWTWGGRWTPASIDAMHFQAARVR